LNRRKKSSCHKLREKYRTSVFWSNTVSHSEISLWCTDGWTPSADQPQAEVLMNVFRCRRSAVGFTIIAISSSVAYYFSFTSLPAAGLSNAPLNEANADTAWMWQPSDLFNNATAKAKQRLGRIPNFLLAGAQKAGTISDVTYRSNGVG
jgi:hypothetical protein